MKSRSALVPILVLSAALLGCSTPAPPGEADPPGFVFNMTPVPAVREADPEALPPVRACYVGSAKHCMDLDPRPFAFCLATDRHCPRDGKIVPLDSANMAPGTVIEPYAIDPP